MPTLIPSLSTCSLGSYNLDDFLAAAKRAGYSYFEAFTTWTNAKLGPGAISVDELRSASERHGVQLATLNITNISAMTPAELADNVEKISADLHYARDLGLDAVTLKGAGRDQSLELFAEGVDRVARIAAGLNVSIRLGNHPNNRLMTTDDYRALYAILEHPENVEILADTRHFEFSGQSMMEFLREWGCKVTLIHINDRKGGTSVPLGTGEVDIPAVLCTALEEGYSGFLTVEIEVEDPENTEQYAADAYTYLTGLIYELEDQDSAKSR